MPLIAKIRDYHSRRCLAEVPVDPTKDTLPTFLEKIALHPELFDDTTDAADNNASDPTRFVKRMWFVPKSTKSDGSPMDPVQVRLPSLRGVWDPPLSRTATLSEAFALGGGVTKSGQAPTYDEEMTVLIEGCRNNEEAVSLLYASNCQLRSENDELRSIVDEMVTRMALREQHEHDMKARFDEMRRALSELKQQIAIKTMSGNSPLRFKIMLIGNTNGGKTCLMNRYVADEFKSTQATIGVDSKSKIKKINGRDVNIDIWDTAGIEHDRPMSRYYYSGAKGAMLVYDITKQESFDDIPVWLQDLRQHVQKTCAIFLIGNKCDLEHSRVVEKDVAERFALENGLSFLETSALDKTNVEKAFSHLIMQIYCSEASALFESTSTVNL